MSFFEKYVNSKFYSIIEILFRIVILNLLFILFTVLGLGIFSIFPAFIALVIVIKDVFRESNFETMHVYLKAFKKNYVKAEILFILYVIVGFIFAYNTYYFYQGVLEFNTAFQIIGFSFSLIFDVFFLITIFQSILILIYFPELKIFKTLKFSILFTVYFLPKNILLLISLFVISAITYILLLIPLMFFTFSIIGYLLVKLFKKDFDEIKEDIVEAHGLENYLKEVKKNH